MWSGRGAKVRGKRKKRETLRRVILSGAKDLRVRSAQPSLMCRRNPQILRRPPRRTTKDDPFMEMARRLSLFFLFPFSFYLVMLAALARPLHRAGDLYRGCARDGGGDLCAGATAPPRRGSKAARGKHRRHVLPRRAEAARIASLPAFRAQ